jgi:hypothetical protein
MLRKKTTRYPHFQSSILVPIYGCDFFYLYFYFQQASQSETFFSSVSSTYDPTMPESMVLFKAVLRIRIHQIHIFLGLPAPDPDPLVRCMDPAPAPDPSIIVQK